MISVTFCPMHNSDVSTSPHMCSINDSKINTMPLLLFGVLPCLFINVMLTKPSIAHSSIINTNKGYSSLLASFRTPYSCDSLSCYHSSSSSYLDPTLSLKSPSNIKQSPGGSDEMASCKVAKKLSFSSLLAA